VIEGCSCQNADRSRACEREKRQGSTANAVDERQRGERVSTQRVNQPGRGEAIVREDAHPVEHERPEDWGWHGETGKWGRVGAWIAILILLSYLLVRNHEGRVEDLWIAGIALVMVLILLWDIRRRKNAWRSR
jgi:hypothetical protein